MYYILRKLSLANVRLCLIEEFVNFNGNIKSMLSFASFNLRIFLIAMKRS